MNITFNLLVIICLAYVAVLFTVAAIAERRAKQGRLGILKSPIIYTLSISVYCTAWTFYGAVGSAARNGLEFVTIYLGPTLVFIGWWWLLRKLVRIGATQRITSIADLISSRYGKSSGLAVIVTLLAVVGSTPYIALQLQSLTLSFGVFNTGEVEQPSPAVTAFYIAAGLTLFTLVFGTRNIDANERHHGVVTAIALEAIVKLLALLVVGAFVVWGIFQGPSDTLSHADPAIWQGQSPFSSRWVTLTFLSGTAIICLPRMFQVIVVENEAERHLATASWAFPLYLFLMCLFVLPIAIAGLNILPEGANPDLFVLTVPLSQGQESLAALAFLGGFSSATSMVIVAAIALSTMMSNHIVLPLWLRFAKDRNPESDDVRRILLRSRRISIAGLLSLGYLYFILTGGTTALASIGLIAFLGVAQALPALLGALFWKNATRVGAIWAILGGFIVWAFTLFLPSFESSFLLKPYILDNGLFGASWLKPQALFGSHIEDPLIHATVFSLGINTFLLIFVSLITNPSALERLQTAQFANVFKRAPSRSTFSYTATPEDLLILGQRILGRDEAMRLFNEESLAQGKTMGLPDATNNFITRLEREFTGSVGAATAHAMIGQVTGAEAVSVEELIAVADETAQIMEYSAQLETQSAELADAAEKLTKANSRLTILGAQKDAFLSQVSHELRTPMTSIRSFAEILRDTNEMDETKRQRFSSIIHDESMRLTRLLDEILDLSFLESGRVQLTRTQVNLSAALDRAVLATETQIDRTQGKINVSPECSDVLLYADFDRMSQVFINLITNALKYGRSKNPTITVSCQISGPNCEIDFIDDGPGIPNDALDLIFEKFARLDADTEQGSAGLGLPISREIARMLDGDLICLPRAKGAHFRVILPHMKQDA